MLSLVLLLLLLLLLLLCLQFFGQLMVLWTPNFYQSSSMNHGPQLDQPTNPPTNLPTNQRIHQSVYSAAMDSKLLPVINHEPWTSIIPTNPPTQQTNQPTNPTLNPQRLTLNFNGHVVICIVLYKRCALKFIM